MGDDGGYVGMFSGQRFGGLPTVKLNIIGNELDMFDKGSNSLGRSGLKSQVLKVSCPQSCCLIGVCAHSSLHGVSSLPHQRL